MRQAIALEGTTKDFPAIIAHGSEAIAAAVMSEGACNTAVRRRLKEAVSFMVVEMSVGVSPGDEDWGSEAQQSTTFYTLWGGVILTRRRAKSGGEGFRQLASMPPKLPPDVAGVCATMPGSLTENA